MAHNITVTTVPATTIPAGHLQVTAATRAVTDKATGKRTEIAAANRSRSILIPEFTPQVSSKYAFLVVAALMDTAKAQLSAQWKDQPGLTEVSSALYTEDALLAFAARESESKKLTADAIATWYDQSELKAYVLTTYNAQQQARFLGELKNIAAPVPSYNEEKALKRIATLGKFEGDMEHEVCAAMIAKLTNLVARIVAEREALGSLEELPD